MSGWHLLILLVSLSYSTDKGNLLIQSEPRAQVIWDGVTLARTDDKGRLSIEEIPVGRFSLVLKKEGFEALERDVEVKPGRLSLILPLHRIKPAEQKNAPTHVTRPANPRPVAPSPAKSNAGSKSQTLPPEFKVKDRGPVTLWPVSQATQPEKSAISILWWVLIGILFSGLIILALRKRSPKVSTASGPGLPLIPRDLIDEESPPTERHVSFLSELKVREELLEHGVEIVTGKAAPRKGPVIDIEASPISEPEEK